uniref:Uncharacterized protein n=1 Tax=Panagrolaimus superbus TaxID=310955 RepID=A0A914YMT2_9BILA
MKFCFIFAGFILVLINSLKAFDVSDLKDIYQSFETTRQCRASEVQECLYQTWQNYVCLFKDVGVNVKRAEMDTYMATKCSMNLLINHYTPQNSQDEIYLKLNKGYTKTEGLRRGDVGDTNELQKLCFIQEMIECFHRHECDIHLHSTILGNVYDTNQRILSQIWHTTAYYVKEKWQQLKDLLFN